MTSPRDPDGSTRITSSGNTAQGNTAQGNTSLGNTSGSHTPTTSGADVTGRMTGTTGPQPVSTAHTTTTTHTTRPGGTVGDGLHHKTSAAAVFALVFGLSALFCALTAILSPAAVVFGIIGLILAFVGLKMTKRPGVHGHGVAIGGLITALLGLLLGGAVLAGAAALVNSDKQLDRISNQIDKLRDNVPSGDEVTTKLPGGSS